MPLILKVCCGSAAEAETARLMKFKDDAKVSEAIEEIVATNK